VDEKKIEKGGKTKEVLGLPLLQQQVVKLPVL
jgi:hypothetical protein